MHTADANAAALPLNAHSKFFNPISAESAWAAIRDKSFNYSGKSYAELALCDSAIWQLLSTESGAQEQRIALRGM
jgi:hypothetical protein